jgi:hypothetical protein
MGTDITDLKKIYRTPSDLQLAAHLTLELDLTDPLKYGWNPFQVPCGIYRVKGAPSSLGVSVIEVKTGKGVFRLITTYDGVNTGDQPLKPFDGEPLGVVLTGRTPVEIAEEVRTAITDQFFVGLAVQFAVPGMKPHILNA